MHAHTRRPLTFAIRFEISVHRWGLAVVEHWPAGRGFGTGAKAHVGGWGDLLAQGRELHGAWGHGHIVRFVYRLWQTAWLMVWRGIGTHGYIVLVYLFCGLATHWHHSFVFLRVTKHTYMFKHKERGSGMKLRLRSLVAHSIKEELMETPNTKIYRWFVFGY